MKNTRKMPATLRHLICHELCSGVPRAKPEHPTLQKEVDTAYWVAQNSASFRSLMSDDRDARQMTPNEQKQARAVMSAASDAALVDWLEKKFSPTRLGLDKGNDCFDTIREAFAARAASPSADTQETP